MARPSASAILERALSAPRRWPVRWRLAAVSAALTLVILLVFAAVVGRLTSNRLESDFRNDLRGTAGQLAFEVQVSSSGLGPGAEQLDLSGVAMPDRAHVRVVSGSGDVYGQTQNAPDLGPPQGGIHKLGSYEVATAPVPTSRLGFPTLYVQYARDHADLQATIDRLWLFLGGGVLVGTVLAYLAGLAVAGRAMRPISSLTAAAREITSTRDPSRRIPNPGTDDEVGELAQTLDDMLRALDDARSETQQAMHRQREFVADASHELRTPLTSILANLELLQTALERGGADEDRAAVTSALRSSQRMRTLVADLLLLARADAGRTSARRECDLTEIAAAAIAEVLPVAGGRELSLHPAEHAPVQGNPDELHRLVLNLLDNAVTHTPEGTEITVSVKRDDGYAVLEVCDDGPGIPQGMEDQVFGRFVRGMGPADQAAGDGTGLGLSIVEAVATSHGGTARAGSSERGGARFAINLPAAMRTKPRGPRVASSRS